MSSIPAQEWARNRYQLAKGNQSATLASDEKPLSRFLLANGTMRNRIP